MDELIRWFADTPQGQFVVGVLVLVFGSKAVLSEENLKGKLSGISLPSKWLRNKQQKSAEREVAEVRRLREQDNLKHQYIVEVTETIRRWEIDAADKGHVLPPPRFRTYIEWLEDQCKEDEN